MVNPNYPIPDHFHGLFLNWYCSGLKQFCQELLLNKPTTRDLILQLLAFWNAEEARLEFLRFDKDARIQVRNCMKDNLLLAKMEELVQFFSFVVLNWSLPDVEAVYQLLLCRKSLLTRLDEALAAALLRKGHVYLQPSYTLAKKARNDFAHTNNFVTLLGKRIELNVLSLLGILGQYYNMTSDLIAKVLGNRSEMLESRNRVRTT